MRTLWNFLASVAVPALNEGMRLPRFLGELVRLALERNQPPVEIVIVDDGSSTEHLARHRHCVAAAAERLARAGSHHRIRLVEGRKNQGKGAAIRRGWSEADPGAAWLGFLDADGAVGASEFWRLVAELEERGHQLDVLCGSRILMAGRRIHRSTYRHMQGRVFAALAEWTFGLKFYDTQCGVKFFRAALLRPELETLSERAWLLDLEVLALIHRLGGRLREEPIDWSDPGGSKVRFGTDALRMLVGLRRIRRNMAARLMPQRRAMPTLGSGGAVNEATTRAASAVGYGR